MELEYHIMLPKQVVIFSNNKLTFSVEKMKSRLPSVFYFILHLYDKNDDEIIFNEKPVYKSNRWAIDRTYSTYHTTFEIDESCIWRAIRFQIELVAIGITSENPLYFNGLMFNEREYKDYHEPREVVTEKEIGFLKSSYANLYGYDGNYLQVIRPTRANMFTNRISASPCTVLAPHFDDEADVDNPVNVFMEFINQTEQRIDVLR